MRIYSYVVARDFGFAPHPFGGFCTLCTCKPEIRRLAAIDDWVIGTGTAGHARRGFAVFAMKVTETMTFDEYWGDPRFVLRRPNLQSSLKRAFGDNIYHHDANGGWIQEDSHHSLLGGGLNRTNLQTDTRVDRVLISDDFYYWGGSGPKLPEPLQHICALRGHRSRFDPETVRSTIVWVRSHPEAGYLGEPLNWTSWWERGLRR